MSTITEFISSVGFPIACVAVCFWYIYKQDLRHDEETDRLRTAIENNTLVMQELVGKISSKIEREE